MRRREFLTAGALAPVLLGAQPAMAAAAAAKPYEVKTGGARMVPIAGGNNVWVKKLGSGPVKVLLLHGGPGFSHDYLECFEDFLPQAGIEMYYYDQLGCGNSDHPTDTRLWTVERYTDEVEQVRQALGLENFVLFGHSWGGMLTYEYALKYGQHLRGAVVSNMTAGVTAYNEYARTFRAELSAEDLAKVDKYEAAQQYDAPEYQQIVMEKLYTKHICRLNPWPEPVTRSLNKANFAIYNQMQGPNEFVIIGNFKGWERWADLPKIKTRTLVMGARYDEMDPEQMRKVASLIPNAKLFISEQGSHMAMYDDQQAYFGALIPFLKSLA